MFRMTIAAAVLSALAATAAAAQDVPLNTAATPGIPGYAAVNPALDASGPYLSDGTRDFYHPMVRERALQSRVQAALAAGRLRPAEAMAADHALQRVKLEARTQIARHGDLRDWDRERLNDMMNHLVDRFGALKS